MADGTSKPIAAIVVGDEVASWDFETGTLSSATVLHTYTVQRDAYYVVDGIHVTAEHPFCTGPGQYTEVRELSVGTKVADVTAHGLEFQPVAEFELVQQPGTFHNRRRFIAHNKDV